MSQFPRTRIPFESLAVALASLLLAWPAIADNVAPDGTGISGIHRAGDDLTTVGVPWSHVGAPENLNDGANDVILDTWAGVGDIGGVQTSAYVGILWPASQAAARRRASDSAG